MKYFFLVVVTSVAVFLRFYKLRDRFLFSGEVGHNLLELKNAFVGGHIPLIGPPTSHPWLHFGPFFYWIYGPVLYIFKFDPMSYAYFGAFVSVLTVIVNFFVVKSIFNQRTAILSSILITFSPLFLWFSLGARFFAIVPLLSLIFFYMTVKIISQKHRNFLLYGFLYGSSFSFHYTPIMLVPFVLSAFVINRIKMNVIGISKVLLGFLLAVLPIIIYDIIYHSNMVKNIVLWVPYRVVGFFGVIPKNTVNKQVVVENASSIWSFLSESLLPKPFSFLTIIIYACIALYIFFVGKKVIKNREYKSPLFILLLLTFWGFLSIFIHGSPPIHYFVPILFVPLLFFALFLDYIWKFRNGKTFAAVLLSFIVLTNIKYSFSDNWFFKTKVAQNVMYEDQLRIIKYIIRDADGKKFVLRRVGPNDQFEENYAQNYTFLLWLYGNEPVKISEVTYTIYEDIGDYKKSYMEESVVLGDVVIVKSK